MVMLASMKNYYIFTLLFLAVVMLDLPEKLQRTTQNLIMGLILFQIPIVILQRSALLPGAAQNIAIEDFSGGYARGKCDWHTIYTLHRICQYYVNPDCV